MLLLKKLVSSPKKSNPKIVTAGMGAKILDMFNNNKF